MLSLDDLLTIAEEDLPRYGLDLEQTHDILPCSASQARMLAITSEAPTAYVSQASAHFHGLDLTRYRLAWDRVVTVHPILRTVFVQVGPGVSSPDLFYAAVVLHDARLPWTLVGASDGVSAAQLADRELARGLPLGHHMLRFAVLEGPDDEFDFVLTIHQALHDAPFLDLVFQDLVRAYESEQPVPGRAEHALYLQHIQSLDTGRAQEFWKRRLNNYAGMAFPPLPCVTFLPTTSNVLRRTLTVELASAALRAHADPSDLLAAAWAVVLRKHSGTDDICFGRLVHTRPAERDHLVLGPTQNVIPVRLSVDDALTVSSFVAEVARYAADAGPFQFLDIDQIKQTVPAVATAAALFSTVLDVTVGASRPASPLVPTLDFTPLDSSVAVHATVHRESVELRVAYDHRVLERGHVHWLTEHLCAAVIELANAHEGLLLGDVSAVSQQERHTQVVEWNPDARMLADPRCCIHELVEREVRAHPNKVAIEFLDGVQLTYTEMNAK
ncbi:hypothetical protein HKX48_002625, partial [Thoreauomyces humboldtii]